MVPACLQRGHLGSERSLCARLSLGYFVILWCLSLLCNCKTIGFGFILQAWGPRLYFLNGLQNRPPLTAIFLNFKAQFPWSNLIQKPFHQSLSRGPSPPMPFVKVLAILNDLTTVQDVYILFSVFTHFYLS